MKERLIGREQEYGMKVVTSEKQIDKDTDDFKDTNMIVNGPSAPKADFLRALHVQRIIRTVTESGLLHVSPHGSTKDFWLSNGSRLYIDYGALLEIASAECRVGGLDLVIQEKASEMILNRAVKHLLGSGTYEELSLYKNNTGPSGGKDIFPEISYGHHQNYLYATGKEADISYLLKTFIPVSLILSGSGHVSCVNSKWRYVMSPRASHIVQEEAATTINDRPLINCRERPSRFHLISRDATRCELQTWLVDMTTHLVMRLGEEGWEMPDGFALQVPVTSLHLSDSSFGDYLNNQSGTWMIEPGVDVLEYNRVFLEAAKQLSPLSEEEKDALEEWESVLELLAAKALDKLIGELDWVTKWNLIRNQMEKHGYGLDDLRAWKTDLSYHDISDDPNLSWFARLDNLGYIRHLADSEDIKEAMENPPSDTRAFCRGRLIRLASQYPELRRDIRGIDWGSVSLLIDGSKLSGSYHLGHKEDPFVTISTELEALYAKKYGILSE